MRGRQERGRYSEKERWIGDRGRLSEKRRNEKEGKIERENDGVRERTWSERKTE